MWIAKRGDSEKIADGRKRHSYDIAHSVETANRQASELQASTKTAVAI